MKQLYTIILTIVLLLAGCSQSDHMGSTLSTKELKAWEKEIYDIRSTLVHEHTYDKANVKIADSIYQVSIANGSEYGKLIALEIKFYALITDQDSREEFLETVDEFIALAKKMNDALSYYDGLNAKVYYYMGEEKYVAAQDMITEVLKEAEKTNNKDGLYFSNYMLGQIYEQRSNQTLAEPYFVKALQYTGNDSIKESLIYRELSIINTQLSNHEKALEYAIKSRDLACTDVHKIWSEHQYLATLFNIADAIQYEQEFLKSPLNNTDIDDGILPLYQQEQLNTLRYIKQENWAKAEETANRIEYENVKLHALLELYKQKKDFAKAYEVQEQLNEMQDSAQHALQLEALSEMEAKLGNSQLKLQSEELRARNMRTIYISVISILFIIGAVFVYINFKSRKHNQELSRKNQELDIARQKAEHASQVKSVFLRNMTHEFNTPLNQICGFSQLLSDKDFPLDEENVREMSSAILESGTHLTHVLQNIVEVTERLSNMTKLEDVESILKTVEHPEEETK